MSTGRPRWSGASAVRQWQRLRDRAYTAAARPGFADLGRGSVLALPVRLAGEHRISIGPGVYVGAGSWLQVIGAPAGSHPVLSVGAGCRLSGAVSLSATVEVIIEESVLIARGVHVSDHDHAFADHDRAVVDQGLANVAPVRIGRGAWLGQNCVVTSGVHVGAGAVVAAGAVVLHDVEPHTVVGGIPARPLRP